MEYTHWWGPHWHWFWIVPFLFMILMIACAALVFRRAGGRRRDPGYRIGWMPLGWCGPGQDSMARRWAEKPREILDRRYASGEITKERYEQIKSDVDSSSCSDAPGQQGAYNA